MTSKLEQAARPSLKADAAMQQALEVIELMYEWLNAGTPSYVDESKEEAITALRSALAESEALAEQAEQEQFYFATPHNRPNCPNCGANAPNHYAGCSRIAQSYEERLK